MKSSYAVLSVSHGCVQATCLGGTAEGFSVSLLRNGHTCWNSDAAHKIPETEEALKKNGIEIADIGTGYRSGNHS